MRTFPFRGPALRLVSIMVVTGAFLCVPPPAHARPADAEPFLFEPAPRPDPGDTRISPAAARSDTIDFGYYEIRGDGLEYAVLGGLWTWDHGATDPREGWTARDLTVNDGVYWRHVTPESWMAEGGPLPAPTIVGAGFALCGATAGHADSLGWIGGLGYGDEWCQRLTSPPLTYDGTGSVDLGFQYFNQSELDYDYTTVVVTAGTSSVTLNAPGFSGNIGIDSLGVITPATYSQAIQNSDLGGGSAERSFTVTILFKSDGGMSDESHAPPGADWDTFYGAVGVDDVTLGPANLVPPAAVAFDFESGLQGWTATMCPGVGSYFGIAGLDAGYIIQDPCACRLSGNVVELHDDFYQHPEGQHEMLISPIVDRKADLGDPTYLEYNQVMAEFDQYSELPMENGAFYRTGWIYYPYDNPHVPGLVEWSPRVGISTFYYEGSGPLCAPVRNIGTNWGLPVNTEQLRFVYELYSSCIAFGVDPCSGVTNFTPLIDNLRIRNVSVPLAPGVLFDTGTRFQDGFGQNPIGLLSPSDPGNVNVAYNLRASNLAPRLGDSLVVRGPTPSTATRWEARIWWRLRRTGPSQSSIALFNSWKTAMMTKGIDFFTGTNPDFTWGYLDSVETTTQALKYKFCSQFRDGPSPGGLDLPPDPCFNWGGGGEQGEGNEILPDLCFTPGTKIEYFLTANYICLPGTYQFLPDTTGSNYEDIEILPSYRTADGAPKFPGLLYIDASNRPYDQVRIEAALWSLYSPSGGPIPEPRPWDRYDYLDPASVWKASFYRDYGGNNGAAMPQLLGYRSMIMDLGTLPISACDDRDWLGLQQWLNSTVCAANNRVQALYLSGSGVAQVISNQYAPFLFQDLGTTVTCATYNELNCPPGETENDENFCVRLEAATGSPYPPQVPMDLYGSWCPSSVPFGVLGVTSGGQGNLRYHKVGSTATTNFAQVRTDHESSASRYRSIINGFDLGNLAARDGDNPATECAFDSATVVTAIRSELASSFGWLTCRDLATMPLVRDPCTYYPTYESCPSAAAPEDQDATPINELQAIHPNPVGARAVISYSLAADGPARLEVFSVDGRRIRTLVQESQKAGPHQATWDGTDDRGRPVGAGIYWNRLQAGSWTSNRKMVVLQRG